MKHDVLISELNSKTPAVVNFVRRAYGAMAYIKMVNYPICVDADGTPAPSYFVDTQQIGKFDIDNMVINGERLYIPCTVYVNAEKYRTDTKTSKTLEDSDGLYQLVHVPHYQQEMFTHIDIAVLANVLAEHHVYTPDDLNRIEEGRHSVQQEDLRGIVRNAALDIIRKNEFRRVLKQYKKRYPNKISDDYFETLMGFIDAGNRRVPMYEEMNPRAAMPITAIVDMIAEKAINRVDRKVPRNFNVIVETLADGQRQVYVESAPDNVIDYRGSRSLRKYLKGFDGK